MRGAFVGLMAVVLAAGACAAPTAPGGPGPVVVSTGPGSSTYRGAELDPARAYPLPQVTLTDTSGQPYDLRTGSAARPATQPVTVVFFGYSNCPDVCTGILADIAGAKNRLPPAQRAKVRVLLVTTDPARDTPPVLKAYLDRIDPEFIGLTGDLGVITSAAESVGVPVTEAKQLPSGGYEVVHGTQVIGFGKDARAVVVWTNPTPLGDLKADLETLMTRQG